MRQQLQTGQSDIVCAGVKRHPVPRTELQTLVPIGLLTGLEHREIVQALLCIPLYDSNPPYRKRRFAMWK